MGSAARSIIQRGQMAERIRQDAEWATYLSVQRLLAMNERSRESGHREWARPSRRSWRRSQHALCVPAPS